MVSTIYVKPGVRVICTDRGTHPSRELAPPLEIHDDPEWRAILHSDDELSPAEADWLYLDDTIGYWSHDAKRGGRVQVTKVEVGQTQLTEAGDVHLEVGDPGDGRGHLWRFRCPTCRRDVPMRTDSLRLIIEGYSAAKRTAFDISSYRS